MPSPPVNVSVPPSVTAAVPLSPAAVIFLLVTAPLVTVKFAVAKLAIPLLLVVASSPLTTPLLISIPSPAVICALTSAALGPVYVNTPLELL